MAPPPDSGAALANERFWVAVLPFKQGGRKADLADGLTDDTVTGLSKFSYLRVIARRSSSRYVGQSVDVRTAGKRSKPSCGAIRWLPCLSRPHHGKLMKTKPERWPRG